MLNFRSTRTTRSRRTFPFSNAALGIFSTYAPGLAVRRGQLLLQQLRVVHPGQLEGQPAADAGLRHPVRARWGRTSTRCSRSRTSSRTSGARRSAPILYEAGCVGGVNPCTGNNRQAKDPRNGALLGVGQPRRSSARSSSARATSPTAWCGRATASTRPATPSRGSSVGPRFGAAYDVSGNQQLVVRGSAGLYFDRPDGNTAFGTVANPPTATSLTQQWGQLSDLANSQFAFGPVPTIVVNQYDSAIPKDFQWNLGFQTVLPWASSIDVSWVGHHAFDVLANTQNGTRVNLNAIDVGTTLTAAGQDPDAGAPGTALNNNLLRPFRGYVEHQRADAAVAPDVPLAPAVVAAPVAQRVLVPRSTTPGRSTTRATSCCRVRSSG